jgi:hypothetical protein
LDDEVARQIFWLDFCARIIMGNDEAALFRRLGARNLPTIQ